MGLREVAESTRQEPELGLATDSWVASFWISISPTVR